ncbi:MAG: hypothetical protein HY904_14960 [Deltaproteobacteria bacterium]|nr:hypothetical protein [Deltaproteobacteria bacterium]
MAHPVLSSSTPEPHSPAWVAQVWISFVLSALATVAGVYFLPVDAWMKGYLLMGVLFTMGSTLSLAKTTRDLHESHKLTSRVEEARVERLLTETALK